MDWDRLVAAARWLRRRAENVSAAFLLIMFLCFILTIVARYVFNYPLGWTEEASLIAWIWCTLWGAIFVLRERDEVRFDIFYNAVSPAVRRVFTIAASAALILLIALSLPATWRYVIFMKREHSAYLKMRFDYLYSIYVIFAVVCILRQAWLGFNAWRGPRGRALENRTDIVP